MFHEVKVNLVSAEAERICIDRMVKGQEKAFSTPEGLADVDSRMASLVRGVVLFCVVVVVGVVKAMLLLSFLIVVVFFCSCSTW